MNRNLRRFFLHGRRNHPIFGAQRTELDEDEIQQVNWIYEIEREEFQNGRTSLCPEGKMPIRVIVQYFKAGICAVLMLLVG